MPDARHIALAAVTGIVFFGTAYSVAYDTYLDTSNPFLTHLPHPLSNSNYFASKSNFLNVYFIKKSWAWTSAAFLLLWVTSPSSVRTQERVMRWIVETAVWLIFTGWFFGPALLSRVTLASGGECFLALPSGNPISIPPQYCFGRTPVSPASHPDLFTSAIALPSDWQAVPALRKGHDVSGHIFLLTMSILFLSDQLRHSLRVRRSSTFHTCAVGATVTLIGLWLFACYTTSIYFHTPMEKFTGYALGVAGFTATQLISFW